MFSRKRIKELERELHEERGARMMLHKALGDLTVRSAEQFDRLTEIIEKQAKQVQASPTEAAPAGTGLAAASALMKARLEEGPAEDDEDTLEVYMTQLDQEMKVLFSDEPPEHTQWHEGTGSDAMWFSKPDPQTE